MNKYANNCVKRISHVLRVNSNLNFIKLSMGENMSLLFN